MKEEIVQSTHMVEIFVVSDICDAPISPRPYRSKPYDNRTALEEISGMAQNGKMAWDVAKSLVINNRKNRAHYTECIVPLDKGGSPPVKNFYSTTISENSSKT